MRNFLSFCFLLVALLLLTFVESDPMTIREVSPEHIYTKIDREKIQQMMRERAKENGSELPEQDGEVEEDYVLDEFAQFKDPNGEERYEYQLTLARGIHLEVILFYGPDEECERCSEGIKTVEDSEESE